MHLSQTIHLPQQAVLPRFRPFDTKHPYLNFAMFRRELLKGQGRSLRMPEGFALGSYADYTYASAMKDSQNCHQHRDCFRHDIELIDLQQTFETFLSIASVQDPALSPILHGKVYPVIPNFYWKKRSMLIRSSR